MEKKENGAIDASVEEELNKLHKTSSIATAAVIVCFVFVFVCGIFFPNTPIIPIGFGALVVAGLVAGKFTKKYNAYFKEHVVRNITLNDCDFLDNVHFEPSRGIPCEAVDGLKVLSFDRYESNDLITAKYKGVEFTQSDVYMCNITHDKDGHTHESTVFRGRWLIFDFNKDFEWNMQLISKGFYGARKMGSGFFGFGGQKMQKISLEDDAFNKTYSTYAQSEHEAFYILTPNMMEALKKLRTDVNAPLMLVFTGGVLHIAVFNNKDAFESKVFGKLDIEAEKKRMYEDLKFITDFVDVLSLERDIFKH